MDKGLSCLTRYKRQDGQEFSMTGNKRVPLPFMLPSVDLASFGCELNVDWSEFCEKTDFARHSVASLAGSRRFVYYISVERPFPTNGGR